LGVIIAKPNDLLADRFNIFDKVLYMASASQLEVLDKGVQAWNSWREQNASELVDLSQSDLQGRDLVQINLSSAQLSGAQLNGAVLAQADLQNADLSRANLSGADLTNVNLRRALLTSAAMFRVDLTAARLDAAKLTGSFLIMASLEMANLQGADLAGAYLMNVSFAKANLSGTVFNDARMESTVFADTNLELAKGLEKVIHSGPSTIGIDTLYRSNGRIPEAFLRGAGVPDDMIILSQSLLGQRVLFDSCFISYSTKDQEFAERLYGDLQTRGVRCWFAPHDVRGGRRIHQQIEDAIRSHDRMLLILSEASMSSGWVSTEVSAARRREASERKRVLFPIRLVHFDEIKRWTNVDPDTGKDAARDVREYFIPDFTDWKDLSRYESALQRLLQDLKAGDDLPE
jgi:hypothetical protein